MRRREFILTAAGLGAAVGLAACGKSGSSTTPGASAGASASSGEVTGEVKVTFQQFGNSKVQANFLNGWAKKFTAAHPQATVKLQPITASENDYYTKQSQKWVVDSKAFTDALTAYEQVWNPGLGPTPQQALAPTWTNTVAQELLPQQKLAIDLDGSWLSNNWLDSGAAPWPEWHTTLGNAYMPTQNGEGSGKVTMSGGWTWAIPKNAQNANAAWEFIKMLTSKEGELEYDIKNVQIPVRTDVAKDPSYLKANPTNPFFSDLVESTIYRPAYPAYAKISLLLQQAPEKVITKTATPEAAAKFYTDGVTQIVGQDKTTTI